MPFVARLVSAAPAALRHENLCIIRAGPILLPGGEVRAKRPTDRKFESEDDLFIKDSDEWRKRRKIALRDDSWFRPLG